MMSNIALDRVSKAFVLYDILNEPDSQGLGWDFMTKAYLDIIQEGQNINPGMASLRIPSWQDSGAMCSDHDCMPET
jgi:hypothetical protein